MVHRSYIKWGFRKLRAEVTAAQEVIAERLKDDIKADGLPLSVDKFRPTRTMGTKEERIQNMLKPYYDNAAVWHFEGGLCETLENELVLFNPPHDDLKDALHQAIGILKFPLYYNSFTQRRTITLYHAFGRVPALEY